MKEIDFHNSIDAGEEFIAECMKVNTTMWLLDSAYEELYERANFKGFYQNKSFDEVISDDDTTVNVYANFHSDGNVRLEMDIESDEQWSSNENIPLLESEKECLRVDFERACSEVGLDVSELMKEAEENF